MSSCLLFALLAFLPLGLASQQAPFQITANDAVRVVSSDPSPITSLTPRNLVELPSPGRGVANAEGTLMFVPVSRYSFEEERNVFSLFVSTLESTKVSMEISLDSGGDSFWLDKHTISYGKPNETTKTTTLYSMSIEESPGHLMHTDPIQIGTFPSDTVTSFRYSPATRALVFSAYVYPDGSLTEVANHTRVWDSRKDTALIYEGGGMVRSWDKYVGPARSLLFSVELSFERERGWRLGHEFVNLLNGTEHHVPVEPLGGKDDFSVFGNLVVYTTRVAPEAMTNRQDVYLVSTHGDRQRKRLTSGEQGPTQNPIFSLDGKKVAWLEQAREGVEIDRNRIVIYGLPSDISYAVAEDWDRSPESLVFSGDSSFLYLTVGEHARSKVFVLAVAAFSKERTPLALTNEGTASGLQILPGGRLLFTRMTLESPNNIFLFDRLHDLQRCIVLEGFFWSQVPQRLTSFGEETLREKNLAKRVHGFIVKPKGWTEGQRKRWPVVLMIHGGPQDVNGDRWSVRWAPALYSQKGYFVVAINPTGSTTFGQEFVEAIRGDWGGKPFVDLQKGWEYVLNNHPEIDPDRAVAVGGSFGGYAINWIQGHPEFGFNFKALVCLDGILDAEHLILSMDVTYTLFPDWNGAPWNEGARATYNKFNPKNFLHKWYTPELIIHGDTDYRVPVTEGIAAYQVLQQRGVPSRLIVLGGENHWVTKPHNLIVWHEEIFKWFDRFAGESSVDV